MHTEDIISSLSGSIAIIGAGNAPGDFGNQIDTYSNVIRIHNYRIDEYSEKVGTKTTLICHCDPSLEPWTKDITKICPFQRQSPEVLYMYNCGNPGPTAFAYTNAQENTNLIWPTTGMSLLWLFEKLGINADVFFIDGYKTGHYYDPTICKDDSECSPHSIVKEQQRLKELTKLTFKTEI
jgi:hypothetical protein